MASKNHTRITVWIDGDLLDELTEKTQAVGVSKNRLLRDTLDVELDFLATLPANSGKGARFLKALSRVKKNRVRLSLSLENETAKRLDAICEEKGVPRDEFLNEYIHFLVHGDRNLMGTPSPLDKVQSLLSDPRFEYIQEGDHPYSEMSMSDEVVEEAISLVTNKGKKDD